MQEIKIGDTIDIPPHAIAGWRNKRARKTVMRLEVTRVNFRTTGEGVVIDGYQLNKDGSHHRRSGGYRILTIDPTLCTLLGRVAETLVAKLNATPVDDVWQEAIYPSGIYDEVATDQLDRGGSSDVVVTIYGDVIRWDPRRGQWFVED